MGLMGNMSVFSHLWYLLKQSTVTDVNINLSFCLSEIIPVLPLNVFTASKGSCFHTLFVITSAGIVPFGGAKKFPRTAYIVQIILFLSVL